MAAMTPVISVIMPVRNAARWLREAVASVLAQQFREIELLVIDDGSDDDTPALLAEIARTDSRTGVLRQPAEGIVAALNLGIATARAPLIARLDADDRARPDRLGRQLTFMQGHREIVLVGSAAEIIDAAGSPIGRIVPPTEPAQLARRLRRGNPFIHSSVMMRTEVVRELGGYRRPFAAAEDYDLWLRMAELGGIANIPEALIAYRRHHSNLSGREQIRQAFSLRLAQCSAMLRARGARDPADALAGPPDWWATPATHAFFSPDIAFYRFLDADGTTAPDYLWALQRRLFSLNHVERKLAQKRLLEMLDETTGRLTPRQARLCLLMGLLHPGRALAMAGRAVLSGADERI
jgi:glycosyltransferase involved in cell wall biosynthesis